jgi:hypothetical protein
MKTMKGLIAALLIGILTSCTYNLPPDSNTKIIEGNLGLVKSPKSLSALKRVLTASDNNRAKEYELLRSQIDSNSQMLHTRFVAMQDSMFKENRALQIRTAHIEKRVMDMQTILIIMMTVIVILLGYVIYRMPMRKLKLVEQKSAVTT